jgi:glycosyltransferase involved in cell wall biosynthesis
MSKPTSVLFLVPYPLHHAPSQRFRVELFLPVLQEAGISYHIAPFLDEKTWQVLYRNGSAPRKAWGVIKGYLRRIKTVLFDAPRYDYVFVHREAAPLGPPVFEFIISRILRKRMIYDFDDAIWIPNTSQENGLVNWIKAFWKVRSICRWSYKVAAGNEFLCHYARQYNNSVELVPTCVDTERQHNRLKEQDTSPVVVGWTGSHSTMKYLDAIVPVLERISRERADTTHVEFVVISNKPPQFSLPGLRYIPWKEDSEIQDLLNLHIGIMPLQSDAWSEGKCGFKLIQYLALGIPALASPVGVNKAIIDHGINGYLCTTDEEWYEYLNMLIDQEGARQKMGAAGRHSIEARFSVQANAFRFTSLFS